MTLILKNKPSLSKLIAKPSAKPLAGKSQTNKVAPSTSVAAKHGFGVATQINAQNKAQAEQRKHQPFRLRMTVGTDRKIILLDRKAPFFMYEHHYETQPGKWNGFAQCIKDRGHCPACKKLDKEGRYLMMLSVLDLQSYTDREGTVHPSSKKLLAVPLTMIPKYERLFKRHNENLRGVVLVLSRDTDKSPASGSDFEEVKVLTETMLGKYKEKADPIDFTKAFPPITEAELQAQFYGGQRLAGAEDIDSHDTIEVDDEIPF